jgi:hypothetical protein
MSLSFASPFTMSMTLSIDLLEQTIDELAQDTPALRACASASSVLRSRARHHLFSWIWVDDDRASTLADLLDADPTVLGDNVLSLRTNIRQPDVWSGVSRTGLCTLPPAFTRLEELELCSVDFGRIDPSAVAAALPASLRPLLLPACTFASDAGLVALLRAAPDLRHASLFWCTVHSAENPEHERYAPTVELESLEIATRPSESHARQPWLSVVSARRLVSLKVSMHLAVDIPFWQAWINQAGATMRDLVLASHHPSGTTLCRASEFGSSCVHIQFRASICLPSPHCARLAS